MTIDPSSDLGQFIQQPWVAYLFLIAFALVALWAIAGVVWYFPGDDSCLAAEWKRYRAEKARRK